MTIELGLQPRFMDGKAQSNGRSSSREDPWHRVSVERLIPGTTSSITVNAGKVTNKGIELEGQVVVVDGWKLGASWGISQARSTNGSISVSTTAVLRPTPAGNRVSADAPKNTFNANVDGRSARTAWAPALAVDVNHTDEMYNVACIKEPTAPNVAEPGMRPYCKVPALHLGNARLTLAGRAVGGPARRHRAAVRNIGDVPQTGERHRHGLLPRGELEPEPRMYGLSLSYKW